MVCESNVNRNNILPETKETEKTKEMQKMKEIAKPALSESTKNRVPNNSIDGPLKSI